MQILHPRRMHHHIVEIPEIEIRQVLCQYSLNRSVLSLAGVLIKSVRARSTSASTCGLL